MRRLFFLLVFPLPFIVFGQNEQKTKIKFGKVNPEDFEVQSDLIDSSTNAVVISDIGNTAFNADANNKKFSLEFKREKRIKLLNKNGFDVATFAIPLYTQGTNTEKLDKLKAYTYNLENGKVVRVSLENSSVFTENATKNIVVKKFTLPALREGSIIEISYTISSDFLFHLQPWEFQGQYPCLWSEYNADIPSFFTYLPLSQGYQSFFINSHNSSEVKYTFRDEATITPGANGGRTPAESWEMKGELNKFRWVMKNVPPLKEENFTTTLDNHIAKLEFQLVTIQYPNTIAKNIMSDWNKVSTELIEDEKFGKTYTRANNWLDNQIKPITSHAKTKLEAAENIFNFLRDNFTITRYSYLSGENNLREVFTKRSGNVAEINLLLIAMLRHEDIKADPVILSTRRNGVIHPVYPLMDRFNYVICSATIDSNTYYLDATEPMLAFGKLPLRCFNGNARLITSDPQELIIDPNSLKESKVSTFFFINDEKGNYSGSYNCDMGYYESLALRQNLKKSGKEETTKEISKPYPDDISLSSITIGPIEQYNVPLKVSYDLGLKIEGDIFYFNPLFNEVIHKNPFSTAKREYPVEMPYTFDHSVIVNMEIPKGYVVDEIPKSARVKLNEDEGMFEYIIGKTGENIQLRCRLVLNRAVFDKEDYETLRDFYAFVIKKEAEQIVFKKIK